MDRLGGKVGIMASKIKSAWGFCKQAWDIWGPAMSGAFSVPFAAAAIFSDQKYGPLIWGAMAYGALLFMGFLLFKRNETLKEQLRPKLSCVEIALKEINGEHFCRVSLQNDSASHSLGLSAYLEEIVADDVLREVRQLDFPIQLYTQEELRTRIDAFNGWQPVLPFNVRSNQKVWIEVFQLNEPLACQANIFLPTKRITFIAIPNMIFKCAVYSSVGVPIHFSITYNETENGDWIIKLIRADGSELEIKGRVQGVIQ
jgi:hypothetical protein